MWLFFLILVLVGVENRLSASSKALARHTLVICPLALSSLLFFALSMKILNILNMVLKLHQTFVRWQSVLNERWSTRAI